MNENRITESDAKAIHDNILRLATEPSEQTVTASAGDIVTVTMDTALRVRAVAIHGTGLTEQQRLRLEQAIAEAVNKAVKEAATVRTNHLLELVKRQKP